MNKKTSIDPTQGQPTTISKNSLVVATFPVFFKQPTPMLDKLMRFRAGKYVMLHAGYACYKLSKKLFGLWWNTLSRHKRVLGSDFSFLENDEHVRPLPASAEDAPGNDVHTTEDAADTAAGSGLHEASCSHSSIYNCCVCGEKPPIRSGVFKIGISKGGGKLSICGGCENRVTEGSIHLKRYVMENAWDISLARLLDGSELYVVDAGVAAEGNHSANQETEAALDGADCSDSANSWSEVPPLIESRPAEYEAVDYGISRSLQGAEVFIDFGDDEVGDLACAKLTFRNTKTAWRAYCKGVRLSLKVVEHPEHDLLLENAEHSEPPTETTEMRATRMMLERNEARMVAENLRYGIGATTNEFMRNKLPWEVGTE